MFVVVLVLVAVVAPAQEPPTMDSLLVDFWPEYDKPAMLVIYRGTLVPRVRLPATVSIRIPARVGQPAAVAYRTAEGLYTLEYQMKGEGEESVVSFNTPTRDFQMEYYDPGLDTSTSTRRYRLATTLAHAVRQLTLQVQQPPGAGSFEISPSPTSTRTGRSGVEYTLVELGDAKAGDRLALDVSYYKPANTLTVERPTTPSAGPIFPAEDPGTGVGETTMVVLVVVGAVVVLGLATIGAFRFAARKQPGRREPAASGGPSAAETDSAGQRFCSNCGASVDKGDRFCSRCGSKLKGA
jgi:hypothetical protein